MVLWAPQEGYQVCFNSISFVDNLNLIDTAICSGETVPLDATIPSGVAYSWSPTTCISNPNIANPIVAPTVTTTFTVTITDVCGELTTEDVLITVNPSETPNFTPINPICIGDILVELPTVSNNGFSGTWSPAINNTTTTLYTFTPSSTEICLDNATMTIAVITKVIPLFTQVDPICIGSMLTPLSTTSNGGITGVWSPSLNNLETTSYTFTPEKGQCADSITMTIIINSINSLTLNVAILSEDFDTNQIISVIATGGSGTYQYQLDGGDWLSDSTFEYMNGCGQHTVAIRDALDLCNTQTETTILIMTYPKFFTPNADGYNDSWNIKCLQDNNSAIVHLYDRYGKLLFQFKPSQNAWNGRFNGMMLPSTDYWFVANYQNSNGIEKQYKSHFSLRR